MPQSFELNMISISWENSYSFSSYKLSERPLKPQSYQNGIYEYDIVIYTKENSEYYQFCLKTSGIPYVKYNGINERLYNLDKDLWIIKGEWKKGQRGVGYCECPSINNPGKIFIVIQFDLFDTTQELIIDVNPNIDDFDFEILKNDFEAELWDLLTSNKSKSNIQTNEVRYGDKFFRFAESKLIIDFLNEFTKISNNPKKELKYTTVYQSYEKVKPIPATYKQLAVSGVSKTLPSKSYIENFDIYENRFVCFMLYKIYELVNNNIKNIKQSILKSENEIISIKKQIERLKTPQKLDKENIDSEIKRQEQLVELNDIKWSDLSLNFQKGIATVSRKIIVFGIKGDTIYCNSSKNSFFALKFNSFLFNHFEENQHYELMCKTEEYEKKVSNTGKEYVVYKITDFSYAKCLKEIEILEKQKQNRDATENNNWYEVLSDSQKKERDNQIHTLEKIIDNLKYKLPNFYDKNEDLLNLKIEISKFFNSSFYKSVKIKNIFFKPSMTFIQNVNYRKILNFFNEILNSYGISIEVFGLFELITNYGIREIPQVYELWCLISIIKILETNFGFKHNASDLHKLLSVITPDSKKIDKEIEINFFGNINNRSIKLFYQKKLTEDKRPDFYLEIKTHKKRINLILDAKFKNYNYKKSASIEAKKIKEKYSTTSNHYTFTLHPTSDIKREEKNIKLTNFGGDKIYDENNNVELPFHEYGFLMIKPNQTDNLKKIIGMSFEYLLENEHNAKKDKIKDPKPENEMFCLGCGSTEMIETKHNPTPNRFHYTYKCKNSKCEHLVYVDYCWNCKTKLYKHGSYWDYHKTSMWSIFDIHCPNCGMTVFDKPN